MAWEEATVTLIQWLDRITMAAICLGQPYYVLAPAVASFSLSSRPHGQRRGTPSRKEVKKNEKRRSTRPASGYSKC
uniref:Uncharacterized protein n=1 Tax=Setaria italica TaxID=4555 RepID=K3ZBF1_SETIT